MLLKGATLGLVGNLCIEPKLRSQIAADTAKLLSRVLSMFEQDVKELPFDWIDSVARELAVLINTGTDA